MYGWSRWISICQPIQPFGQFTPRRLRLCTELKVSVPQIYMASTPLRPATWLNPAPTFPPVHLWLLLEWFQALVVTDWRCLFPLQLRDPAGQDVYPGVLHEPANGFCIEIVQLNPLYLVIRLSTAYHNWYYRFGLHIAWKYIWEEMYNIFNLFTSYHCTYLKI